MNLSSLKKYWLLSTVILLGTVYFLFSHKTFIPYVLWETTHSFSVRHLTSDRDLLFEMGTYFISQESAHAYNLDKAEQLFLLSSLRGEPHLYLYHQLSRVSFLKGDFQRALQYSNAQIGRYGLETPNAYYMRGLIEGFMGNYIASSYDYEVYLRTDPNNWAALNDYAWVLLKQGRAQEALVSLDWGLMTWPENAWLLNSKAAALVELGRDEYAKEIAELAVKSALLLSESEWSLAYPGNDPFIALDGKLSLQEAARKNLHNLTTQTERLSDE